jgi:riboflavin biosynthesis pyrimidine reductase
MNRFEQTPFPKIQYDADRIKLTRIFENPCLASFSNPTITSTKAEKVYGPLRFPALPADRPYLYASMVLSLDGKIAFEDAPEGPLIAQTNRLDPDGGAADFWVLNLLRAVSDASMGSGGGISSTKPESETARMFGVDLEGGGHIYDQDLENDRLAAGLPAVPVGVITSLDGSEINFDHPVFKNHPLLPTIITTSPSGLEKVRSKCTAEYFVLDDPEKIPAAGQRQGMPVIITGTGSMPDARVTMRILKKLGLNRVLIEGPSYCHHLIQLGLLDELFLNYSCIYVGGKALSLGMRGDSFTSRQHPHTEMLSIHTHGPHFFYLRHRLIY